MESQIEELFRHFTPETCEDILSRSIPPLQNKQHLRTSSEALHSIRFKGALSKWEGFSDEVSDFFAKQRPNMPDHVLSFCANSDYEMPKLHEEQVYCGDELSVSGRFSQNVLHPVTAVAPLLNINARFGDFKICREAHPTEPPPPKRSSDITQSTKFEDPIIATDKADVATVASMKNPGRLVPDYAAVAAKDHTLRFVGEAKTPWKHKLESYVALYESNTKKDLERAFGRYIQITKF